MLPASQTSTIKEALCCYLQSGFVGGGVVGQPTTVSQALHHDEAGNRQYSVKMENIHDAWMLVTLLAMLSMLRLKTLHRLTEYRWCNMLRLSLTPGKHCLQMNSV